MSLKYTTYAQKENLISGSCITSSLCLKIID